MSPLHTLLAATDLSAPSRHAMARATMIASNSGAALVLLHVLPSGALDQLRDILGREAAPALSCIESETRAELTRIAKDICEPLGLHPRTELARGSVLKQIVDMAEAHAADLLVLGARGKGFMHHLVLGSTAERMLRMTRRALLLVKQLPHEPYQRVLIPVDFSSYSMQAIKLARAVAPQAEITLMHVLDPSLEGVLQYAKVDEDMIHHYQMQARQEAMNKLRKLADDAGLGPDDYQLMTMLGHAPTCILQQEEEGDADLIVIGKHGTSNAEELLLGSVTKHVLTTSKGDVLVVR